VPRSSLLLICFALGCEGRGARAEPLSSPAPLTATDGKMAAGLGGYAASGAGSHLQATSHERPSVGTSEVDSAQEPKAAASDRGPLRVEALEQEEPPIFVLRGQHGTQPRGAGRLVFLHGMCGHGLGYMQSFQRSAAKRGAFIAPQADVSCGGVWAKWSMDVEKLDARIVSAFKKLGHQEPIDDITVIGMSQGATRAAWLARKFPERYTRLISMGAPTAVKAGELKKLRAAVTMAGERERKDLMRQSAEALKAVGVPATSMVIPDADHAGMGARPEETMDAALGWLWENSKAMGVENQSK